MADCIVFLEQINRPPPIEYRWGLNRWGLHAQEINVNGIRWFLVKTSDRDVDGTVLLTYQRQATYQRDVRVYCYSKNVKELQENILYNPNIVLDNLTSCAILPRGWYCEVDCGDFQRDYATKQMFYFTIPGPNMVELSNRSYFPIEAIVEGVMTIGKTLIRKGLGLCNLQASDLYMENGPNHVYQGVKLCNIRKIISMKRQRQRTSSCKELYAVPMTPHFVDAMPLRVLQTMYECLLVIFYMDAYYNTFRWNRELRTAVLTKGVRMADPLMGYKHPFISDLYPKAQSKTDLGAKDYTSSRYMDIFARRILLLDDPAVHQRMEKYRIVSDTKRPNISQSVQEEDVKFLQPYIGRFFAEKM